MRPIRSVFADRDGFQRKLRTFPHFSRFRHFTFMISNLAKSFLVYPFRTTFVGGLQIAGFRLKVALRVFSEDAVRLFDIEWSWSVR